METKEPRWTLEQIVRISRSFMECRVLLTGAELDLFTLCAKEPLSAQQIAEHLGADLRALTVLLDALAAMDLLVKQDGRYQTEPSAAAILDSTSLASILPVILHNVNLWTNWSRLTKKIVDNPVTEWSMPAFIRTMHIGASFLAPQIIAQINPGNAQRLIDVGGGSGTYTIAFLQASPDMRATLFDLPPVIEMAREMVGKAGLTDRVTLMPGDFHKDPLPGGHDLAFVSAIIHQNSPEENLAMFRNIFTALDPGGRIVVRDHIMNPERTRPRGGAFFAVNMLVATKGGGTYTEEEVSGALREAGFERMKLINPDKRMDGLIEAFKP
ncbi:MAG: methyltransferase domain-containing protein [Deltaproteobacteria bacterium]|nr:methyltransferase domain-containing protein [Deltaproteobacteria bacterium]